MCYKQLTQEQRYHIERCKKIGMKNNAIAKSIGVHKTTIGRELKRNAGKRGYRHKQAQRLADERHKKKNKARKLNKSTIATIKILLEKYLSPEQICGYLLRHGISLHHETIYRWIYRDKITGGSHHEKLRIANKPYRKRYGANYKRRGQIPNRVDIDKRPQIVDTKGRIGDCEADTVIGINNQSAIATVVERKTLYTRIFKLSGKQAQALADIVSTGLLDIKDRLHTITFDNGREFACHEQIAEKIEVDNYFAKPYSSWQRGVNENTNGLIRQYFPKDTDFNQVTQARLTAVQEQLNNRPRKTLGFKTPNELFLGKIVDLLTV